MSEGFHTDGGLALQSVRVSDESITVQLKVQFFLTDVLGTDAGNFILVPGSHERRIPSTDERCFLTGIDEERKNAIQVRARAGDAVIFPWNLWHGAAPNLGASKRLSVILRYGQLWCRPIDYTSMEQHRDVLSARQRRLVGLFDDPSHPADYYKPQRQRETLCGPDSGSE